MKYWVVYKVTKNDCYETVSKEFKSVHPSEELANIAFRFINAKNLYKYYEIEERDTENDV